MKDQIVFTACFMSIIKHSLSIKLASKPKFKQLNIHLNVHFNFAQEVTS